MLRRVAPPVIAALATITPAPLASRRGAGLAILDIGLVALSAIVSLAASPAHAAWPDDPLTNVPVCTAMGVQRSQKIVADGAGGAIVTWQDGRWTYMGLGVLIYAQHVLPSGGLDPNWEDVNGKFVGPDAEYSATLPQIVSDGAGGAIIAWQDSLQPNQRGIAAQHVLATGATDTRWLFGGRSLVGSLDAHSWDKISPQLVEDGSGGAIVTWSDRRSGTSYNIYAQHVLASGALDPAWTAANENENGTPMAVVGSNQTTPSIVTDGDGGAIISWWDYRNGPPYIYAQHVLRTGVVDNRWPSLGLALYLATPTKTSGPEIVADGAGGAIVTWAVSPGPYYHVYAQHVLSAGTVDGTWPQNGLPVCTAASNAATPRIVTDGAGGAVIAWWDYRANYSAAQPYAQHVLATGTVDPAWPVDGRAVCAAATDARSPQILSDGSGGAIVTWFEYRNQSDADIYTQHVTSAGAVDPAWPADGRVLCSAAGDQTFPQIVTDGAGGAILSWTDYRNGTNNADVYAQRVGRGGHLDEIPIPTNVAATAQCGSISVNWTVAPGVTGYRVKRDSVLISGAEPLAGPPFVDASPGTIQRCYTVCAVSNSTDGTYSSASCGTAPAAPSVTAAPYSAIAATGSTASFGVFTTGTVSSYVWRKNGVPISGAPSTRTLILTNIQAGDAGVYDVQICNACGCVTSAAATLTICPAIAIASLPAQVRAVEGAASAQIPSAVTGSSIMRWYRGDAGFLGDGAKYSGTTTPTLSLANVAFGDGGIYSLVVQDCSGKQVVSNQCELQVAPCDNFTITTQPSSQAPQLGSPVTFSIVVSGCAARYQWQRNTQGLGWTSIAGATGATYTIASVAAADMGSYRCVVSGTNVPALYSNVATLSVTAKFLTVTATPLDCSSARIDWTANVQMTVQLQYGPTCGNTPSTAFGGGSSGSFTVSLPGQPAAAFKLLGYQDATPLAQYNCQMAYFNNTAANLQVQVVGLPFYGDLYASGDGIPVRIVLTNLGCTAITDPIVLTSMTASDKPPRRSDHTIDLPRDLGIVGLGAKASQTVDGVMFSRTEVGVGPGGNLRIAGTIQYGSRTVSVSASLTLP